MKNNKAPIMPAVNDKKGMPKSNPAENNPKKKQKGASTFNSLNSVITSAVGNVKAASGGGLANEGTQVNYEEER